MIAAAVMVLGAVLLVAGWLDRAEAPAMPLPQQTFDVPTAAATKAPGTVATGLPVPDDPATDSPVATPTAGKASSAYPAPNTLYIPSLGIVAPLVPEEAPDGELVIPGDPAQVGIFVGNPGVDAADGTTVLAGHVTFNALTGALLPLSRITPHALIVTTDAQGRAWPWQTTALAAPDKDDLPSLPSTGPRRLAVVTCGGRVIETSHGRYYTHNVIAFASPISNGESRRG